MKNEKSQETNSVNAAAPTAGHTGNNTTASNTASNSTSNSTNNASKKKRYSDDVIILEDNRERRDGPGGEDGE